VPGKAAEQADYKTWLADAVAELQRRHNVNPAIIPVRVSRHPYIQGRNPKAADQAVSAYNRQSSSHARLWRLYDQRPPPAVEDRPDPYEAFNYSWVTKTLSSLRWLRELGSRPVHGSGRTSPCH
jgi:hypothetical protein